MKYMLLRTIDEISMCVNKNRPIRGHIRDHQKFREIPRNLRKIIIIIILEGKGGVKRKGGRTYISPFLPKLSGEVGCSQSVQQLSCYLASNEA